jgi:hypothetical protein
MRPLLVSALFITLITCATSGSPLKYTIYPEDILWVKASGTIVEVSLTPLDIVLEYDHLSFEFAFPLPAGFAKEDFIVHTSWSRSPTSLTVGFKLRDTPSAAMFAKFLASKQPQFMRSNPAIQLTATRRETCRWKLKDGSS